LGKLQKLSTALASNSGDLPNLAGSIAQLTALVTQAQEAAKVQAALTASKQEASKQLNAVVADTERLGTVLQMAIKQHYGIRAEKLAEFGLQPFRGRRFAKPAPETPGSPTPATPKAPGAPAPAHTETP
jgi:hypothetical protein